MNAQAPDRGTQLQRLALLPRYDGRAPRYTSYPTAVQFAPDVGPATYAQWLTELPHDPAISLYVHVPFCARLCWFCGCNTRVVHRRELISDYVNLLLKELNLVSARLGVTRRVSNIHLGGGTPNMLSTDDLNVLFGALRRSFVVEDEAEIAAELDPAQLTAEWAQAAASHGLTRASLGVQDLAPDVQAAVNRREPFEVVANAAGMLRAAGVNALNLDLMYGLPRQRTRDVLETLDRVLTLKPQRVALFGYAHVPWMKAHQKLIDASTLPSAAERLDQSQAASERLAAEGYVAVGLDHFARPDDALAMGAMRRNFQGYTSDLAQTLLGFGASAIGRLPQGYVQNQPSELAWRKAIEPGGLATARGVGLTPDDRLRGEIIERLMCDLAVDLDEVMAVRPDISIDLEAARAELEGFVRDGVITVDGGRIAVTALGRPFVRSVCMAFDAYADAGAVRHSLAV